MDVLVRDATAGDAEVIAAIGAEAVPAQYAGLVDPAALDAVVRQIYAPAAVIACIEHCQPELEAHVLVASVFEQVVGFLHFDCFGPEPELHRLYLDHRHRGAGIGSLLMDELHARLRAASPYMLLVVDGNDRAVRFYERHGLRVTEIVDGLAYYSQRMGVEFPAGTRPVGLALMRRAAERSVE